MRCQETIYSSVGRKTESNHERLVKQYLNRYFAIRGLGNFEFQARSAVPAITALLTDPEDGVREAATNTLRKITSEVITNAPSR